MFALIIFSSVGNNPKHSVHCDSTCLFGPWICSLDGALWWGMGSDPSLRPPIWGLNWSDSQWPMAAGQASQSPQVSLGVLQHGTSGQSGFLPHGSELQGQHSKRAGQKLKALLCHSIGSSRVLFLPYSIGQADCYCTAYIPSAEEFNWILLYLPVGKIRKKFDSPKDESPITTLTQLMYGVHQKGWLQG